MARSVRKEDTDKTANPEVKYLRTLNGKEIKPCKEEILITANDDMTYIKIQEYSGSSIKLNVNIDMKAKMIKEN